MKRLLILLVAAFALAGVAVAQDISPSGVAGPPQPGRSWTSAPTITLWDNGDTDGTNGYSHCDPGCFGFRREILDDFEVPAGEAWDADGFVWLNLWNTLPVGSGFGAEFSIVEDAAGTPTGPVVGVANVTSYAEAGTGRTWFGRPEGEITIGYDPIFVPEGVHWVNFNVIGPENAFAMVKATVTLTEVWVDYEDFGGLQPGTAIFGVPADLAYVLLGELAGGVPTMPLWAMLGLGLALFAAAMWWLRRTQEA